MILRTVAGVLAEERRPVVDEADLGNGGR